MKVLYGNQTKIMDDLAIHTYHIPSILLMEHAAISLCDKICELVNKSQKILIVCGKGNNGGDGFALARLLYYKGYDVCIYCPVKLEDMSNDERIQANMIIKLQIPYIQDAKYEYFKELCKSFDVLVDAIFGIGLSRNIEGYFKDMIECMNQSHKQMISIDIASGIHGDMGKVMGCAIHATHTLSLNTYKMGQLFHQGREYSGIIHILDMQMPASLIRALEGYSLIDEQFVRNHYIKRNPYSHKGNHGKCLMIGGSLQMSGAITLAAKACLKSGIGLLTLFIPDIIYSTLSMKLESCMFMPATSENGEFALESVMQLEKIIDNYDYIVIGNGIGRGLGAMQLVKCVLQSKLPCILDGDALYLLGAFQIPYNPQKDIICTPHVKEMAYLCNQPIQDIKNDPVLYLQSFIHQHPNYSIIYKDAHTIIANTQDISIYLGANSALAKGGSGDVLCGILAGLYGQWKDPYKAMSISCYMHGETARNLSEKNACNSILPEDIIQNLTNSYKKFE